MMLNGKLKKYDELLQHLINVVSSDRFLKNKSIGKEVPFFIFPFNPEDALKIEDSVESIIKKLKSENKRKNVNGKNKSIWENDKINKSLKKNNKKKEN